MPNKLYVGNLSRETTEDEVRELFSTVGVVASVSIPPDPKTGARQNFAFVEMDTPEATVSAVKSINGKSLNGRTLTITEIRIKSGGGDAPSGGSRSRGRSRARSRARR